MTDARMTPGDLRAEADRLAAARGPAYTEGYAAGLAAAIGAVKDWRFELHPVHESSTREVADLIIEAIEALRTR
jgi:hypothetical protein